MAVSFLRWLAVVAFGGWAQLGCGSTSTTDEPTSGSNEPTSPDRSVTERTLRAVDLDMATQHACAADREGQIWCWGNVRFGEESSISVTRGAQLCRNSAGAVSVATGGESGAALDGDGRLGVWTSTERDFPLEGSSQVFRWSDTWGAGVRSVALGTASICLVDSSGDTYCWGRNDNGVVGTTVTNPPSALSLPTVRSVHVVRTSACALTEAGGAWCWGGISGLQSTLGVDDWRTYEPLEIPGLTTVTAMGMSDTARCFVHDGGKVACWGHSVHRPDIEPGANLAWDDAVGVAVTGDTTCVIRADETVWCQGGNTRGSVGNGTTDPAPDPIPVEGLTGVTRLVGSNGTYCAIDGDDVVWCWGGRHLVETGRVDYPSDTLRPIPIERAE